MIKTNLFYSIITPFSIKMLYSLLFHCLSSTTHLDARTPVHNSHRKSLLPLLAPLYQCVSAELRLLMLILND